jgi:sugar phosphate isomerase/epimerase
VIDIPALTRSVARAGYTGDVEVEVFNADVWAADGDATLATLVRRHAELVAPHLS